jgi:phosphopantothenoylcysteine decarboxylase
MSKRSSRRLTKPFPCSAERPQIVNIVLGISGSIAAYKAADLASQLTKLGHDVRAVMTRAAVEFITPLTIQTLTRQSVLLSLEDEKHSWKPGHIELADQADLLLIAPATANTLANFAHGLAPDSLSSIYLALPRSTPVLIAPAMNGKMWLHPATQRNIAQLAADGCFFVGPASGNLACGYEGIGRLAATDEILAKIAEIQLLVS